MDSNRCVNKGQDGSGRAVHNIQGSFSVTRARPVTHHTHEQIVDPSLERAINISKPTQQAASQNVGIEDEQKGGNPPGNIGGTIAQSESFSLIALWLYSWLLNCKISVLRLASYCSVEHT